MTLHVCSFDSKLGLQRARARLSEFSIQGLRQAEPEWEYAKKGVRGAFLLKSHGPRSGQNIAFLDGEMLAILHERNGEPEWVETAGDFRKSWSSLSDETRAELLEAERSRGPNDDLVGLSLDRDLAGRLPQGPDPHGDRSFSATLAGWLDEETHPILTEAQVAFLRVLNIYQELYGHPLPVIPPGERIYRLSR